MYLYIYIIHLDDLYVYVYIYMYREDQLLQQENHASFSIFVFKDQTETSIP